MCLRSGFIARIPCHPLDTIKAAADNLINFTRLDRLRPASPDSKARLAAITVACGTVRRPKPPRPLAKLRPTSHLRPGRPAGRAPDLALPRPPRALPRLRHRGTGGRPRRMREGLAGASQGPRRGLHLQLRGAQGPPGRRLLAAPQRRPGGRGPAVAVGWRALLSAPEAVRGSKASHGAMDPKRSWHRRRGRKRP